MISRKSEFLKQFGIEHPIILAPLGGGPSTPELVAAVSNAGGLGSLGAAYMTPAQIKEAISGIRQLTHKPFNVNLFAGGWDHAGPLDAEPILTLLKPVHEQLGITPATLPPIPPDPFPQQLEAVLDARPAVFSFTFGIPSVEDMERLHRLGILVLGTATTVEEGRMLERAGVDAVIAQGSEAGAHRGTFAAPFDAAMVPIRDLVSGLVRAVSLPVIAAGGLMDGRDIAEVLARGATAAMLGTAFLACPESGASQAYKQAILAASRDTTVITRAFSGRPARGLVNTFIEQLRGKEDLILPYPVQNALTRPMRTAAAQRGEPGFLSLYAGQGVARARAMPAAQLVRSLVEEMNSTTRGRELHSTT
ncbi:MAG TPA: nitronate monooxygenase [Terriglobales bacterium]|nr:nitronate monooxygenase [Terriglobales bacterium]